jgi:hypothetical protein
MLRRLCVLLAALCVPCPLPADTVVLQATKDNTLFESATGSLSNGRGSGMFVGTIRAGLLRRALVAFDIAGNVPAGAAIQSVRLTLNMSRTQVGPTPVSLHRVRADWGEGTSNSTFLGGGQGAAATTRDATWLHTFFNTSRWSSPGGDFASAPSAQLQVGNIGAYTWGSTPEMVADVQSWLDDPAGNFGWILVGGEGGGTSAKRFDTREHPVAGNRPRLVVEFTGSGVEGQTWSGIKRLYRRGRAR